MIEQVLLRTALITKDQVEKIVKALGALTGSDIMSTMSPIDDGIRRERDDVFVDFLYGDEDRATVNVVIKNLASFNPEFGAPFISAVYDQLKSIMRAENRELAPRAEQLGGGWPMYVVRDSIEYIDVLALHVRDFSYTDDMFHPTTIQFPKVLFVASDSDLGQYLVFAEPPKGVQ